MPQHQIRIGRSHACPQCGRMRPNDLSQPCPGCERLKKDAEWNRYHPDPVKYLEEREWQRVYLEKGFPGHRNYLGWWHEKHCLAHQRYFFQDEAVLIQRRVDEGKEPRIIYAADGIKMF
jgi:hypothetical protein